MSDGSGDAEKWWYDPGTGEVTRGRVSAWTDRMGPYDTEAEARSAMDRVRVRNDAADSWDEEDDDWGVPPAGT